MSIRIYEDDRVNNFLPLVRTRSIFELRIGLYTFLERVEKFMSPASLGLFVRNDILNMTRMRYTHYPVNIMPVEMTLWINGRCVIDHDIVTDFQTDRPTIWRNESGVCAAYLPEELSRAWETENFRNNFKFPETIAEEYINWESPEYIWNLIENNISQLRKDSESFEISTREIPDVFMISKEKIHIGNNVVVEPGVVLDASKGAIILDEDVKIEANAVIKGPVYLGAKSTVKSGAVLREGCNAGEFCNLAGEINNSIILSYSNKGHDGFLGSSYVGEWCNFGAGTTVSNLKNNYSKVRAWVNGQSISTDQQFLGIIMGDHCKTAINTRLNTGTVLDVASNIFTPDFPQKYIPPFSWGGAVDSPKYNIKKMLETADIVMKRRKKSISKEETQLLRKIFNNLA